MNHIYRSVWNRALGAMVAVAEFETNPAGGAPSVGKGAVLAGLWRVLGMRPLAVAVAVVAGWLPGAVMANPTGAVPIVGQATLQAQGNKLTVVTKNGPGLQHSAIDWQGFSIPKGSTTYFQQPDARSTSINRVVTPNPSQIFGTLGSNGHLVLVNPAGITVGAGAVVDTAGFTASAMQMKDADAMLARMRFGDANAAANATAGAVAVSGQVLARSGDVVLLGGQVDVQKPALVQAPNGSTILAAGQQVEITGRGLEGIHMVVQAPKDQARNLGTLQGDAVGMFASTLQHSGAIQANAVRVEGGKVVLRAVEHAEVAGSIAAQRSDGTGNSGNSASTGNAGDTSGTSDTGGTVHVTGDTVQIDATAQIDVSGAAGGGEVRIGGGWQGKDPALHNAQQTTVAQGAQIHAGATQQGDGGSVAVWADGVTSYAGSITAQGGAQGGDGGQVEVSGKQYLDFRGGVDLRAPMGKTGGLLLDPASIVIGVTADVNGDATTGDDVSAGFTSGEYGAVVSQITATQVSTLLDSADLSLAATGDVTVASAITKTGATPSTLTLTSDAGNVNVNAEILTTGAPLGVTLTATAGGIAIDASLITLGGNVTMTAGGSAGIEMVVDSNHCIDTHIPAPAGGNAGLVQLTASTGNIVVPVIYAYGMDRSDGPGWNGGNVTLNAAGTIDMESAYTYGGKGGTVGGVGQSGGQGGNVTIEANGATGTSNLFYFYNHGGDGGTGTPAGAKGTGGTVSIDVAHGLYMEEGYVNTNAPIGITATGNVNLLGSNLFNSLSAATTPVPGVTITGKQVVLGDVYTYGDLGVTATQGIDASQGYLDTSVTSGSAGNVTLTANGGTVLIDTIDASSPGTAGGDVTVTATQGIVVAEQIDTGIYGVEASAQAGDIHLSATHGNVMVGDLYARAPFPAQAVTGGHGGAITVGAPEGSIILARSGSTASWIDASGGGGTMTGGNAGAISFTAKNFVGFAGVVEGVSIYAAGGVGTTTPGKGGDVTMTVESGAVRGFYEIDTSATSPATPGIVTVRSTVGDLVVGDMALTALSGHLVIDSAGNLTGTGTMAANAIDLRADGLIGTPDSPLMTSTFDGLNGTTSLTLGAAGSTPTGVYLGHIGLLELGGTNLATGSSAPVSVTATGTLTVASALDTHGGAVTLQSGHDVVVNQPITATDAKVALRADVFGDCAYNAPTGCGTVTFGANGRVSAGAGQVDIYYNPVAYTDPTPTDYSAPMSGGKVSGGTVIAWMLVNDVGAESGGTRGLQAMANKLDGNYALGWDIDASITSNSTLWNSGHGFTPVGSVGVGSGFFGKFDGLYHTISGLTVNQYGNPSGLFGVIGIGATVENLNLTNATIVVGGYASGILAGINDGVIRDVHSSGDVSVVANSLGTPILGGLVGVNNSTGKILNSSSSAHVSANDNTVFDLGGLVGSNWGSIADSYATGNISGIDKSSAEGNSLGGLVGSSLAGNIERSYSTGSVSVENSQSVIGWNPPDSIGGLVGSFSGGTIGNTYSSATVSATGASGTYTNVGGLVGYISSGNMEKSYSVGTVRFTGEGDKFVGGLIGDNAGSNNVISSYWDTEKSTQSFSSGGTSLTSVAMQQMSSFAGFDIVDTGGSSAIWRIYEGQSAPLLRGFLTRLSYTPVYDGTAQTLDNIADYTSNISTPDTNKIFGSITGLTLKGGTSAETYTATFTNTLHSNQNGYDIAVGTKTITDTGSAVGDISLNNALKWNSGTLSVYANNIAVNAALTGGAGSAIVLHATAGSIAQTAALTTAALTTSSISGTTLTNSGNKVSSFQATNTASGSISLTNTVPLTVAGISQTGGGQTSISNTGSITTTGKISTSRNLDLVALGTGGDIVLNNVFEYTGTQSGTFNAKAHNDVRLGNASSISSTAGPLHVNLISDSDGANGGIISLGYEATIASNGGNILLAGGNVAGTGYAQGRSDGAAVSGIELSSDASIDAGTGSITLRGKGVDSDSLMHAYGIMMWAGTSLTTQGGDITMTGYGGENSDGNEGIRFGGNYSNEVTVESHGGTITIMGTGMAGISNTLESGGAYTGIFAKYTYFSSGTGNMEFTGTDGAGVGNKHGVVLDHSTLYTTEGDIEITGTGGGILASVGDNNHGVWINNSTVDTYGNGNIKITGTGGDGVDFNVGVYLSGATQIRANEEGSITIEGTGGDGTGSHNVGVLAEGMYEYDYSSCSGYCLHRPVLETAGNGNLTITGIGGSGTSEHHGIELIGATLRVRDGALSLQGTAGSSASDHNMGVQISSTVCTHYLCVPTPEKDYTVLESLGAGSITVNGVAGASSNPLMDYDNIALAIDQYSTIRSAGGDVELLGTATGNIPAASSPLANPAVWLLGIIEAGSTNGTGDVTITGTTTATTSPSYGIVIGASGAIHADNRDVTISSAHGIDVGGRVHAQNLTVNGALWLESGYDYTNYTYLDPVFLVRGLASFGDIAGLGGTNVNVIAGSIEAENIFTDTLVLDRGKIALTANAGFVHTGNLTTGGGISYSGNVEINALTDISTGIIDTHITPVDSGGLVGNVWLDTLRGNITTASVNASANGPDAMGGHVFMQAGMGIALNAGGINTSSVTNEISAGSGGDVTLYANVGHITFTSGGIDTHTNAAMSAGNAGTVKVRSAEGISFTNGVNASVQGYGGNGGEVSLYALNGTLGSGMISASASGGVGGNVLLYSTGTAYATLQSYAQTGYSTLTLIGSNTSYQDTAPNGDYIEKSSTELEISSSISGNNIILDAPNITITSVAGSLFTSGWISMRASDGNIAVDASVNTDGGDILLRAINPNTPDPSTTGQINTTGDISANHESGQGGQIRLVADGNLNVSGNVSAIGDKGGSIILLSRYGSVDVVPSIPNQTLDSSGYSDAGNIEIALGALQGAAEPLDTTGNGGDITLGETGYLLDILANGNEGGRGGKISIHTTLATTGGDITHLGTVSVDGGDGAYSSNAYIPGGRGGDAGTIAITAGVGSNIALGTMSANGGLGGDGAAIFVDQNWVYSSAGGVGGRGGVVDVRANSGVVATGQLTVRGGNGGIGIVTGNGGLGGHVDLWANTTATVGGIATDGGDGGFGGNAGAITITAGAGVVGATESLASLKAWGGEAKDETGVGGDAGAITLKLTGSGTVGNLELSARPGSGATTGYGADVQLLTAGDLTLNGIVVDYVTGVNPFVIEASGNILSNGILQGVGTVSVGSSKTLTNAGTISPGGPEAAGTLTITGNVVMGSTSQLLLDLGGTGAGLSDKLVVSGNLTINGAATASLLTGYTPANADAMVVLTAASSTGTFSAASTWPIDFDMGYRLAAGEVARLIYASNPGEVIFTNAGGNLDWATPANWSYGNLPTSSNSVLISSGYAVTHSTGTDTIAALTIGNTNALNVSGGSLDVLGATTLGGTLQVSGSGSIDLQGALNGGTTGALTVSGGSLQLGGTSAVKSMTLTGGAVTGSGSLDVNAGFSQNAGSVVLGGALAIQQASGTLTVGSLSAPSITLHADNGSIAQSAALTTAALTTSSSAGTTLTHASNQFDSVQATNTASGDISLTNSEALAVVAISQRGGDVAISAPAISVTGNIDASGYQGAPGAYGMEGGAGNPGGDITLTASGDITFSANVQLRTDGGAGGKGGDASVMVGGQGGTGGAAGAIQITGGSIASTGSGIVFSAKGGDGGMGGQGGAGYLASMLTSPASQGGAGGDGGGGGAAGSVTLSGATIALGAANAQVQWDTQGGQGGTGGTGGTGGAGYNNGMTPVAPGSYPGLNGGVGGSGGAGGGGGNAGVVHFLANGDLSAYVGMSQAVGMAGVGGAGGVGGVAGYAVGIVGPGPDMIPGTMDDQTMPIASSPGAIGGSGVLGTAGTLPGWLHLTNTTTTVSTATIVKTGASDGVITLGGSNDLGAASLSISASDLTLRPGTTITTTATGDAINLVGTNSVVNQAGASSLFTDEEGRWLVWSAHPDSITSGEWIEAFRQYDATFGSTAVQAITPGNGFLYSYAPPTLTPLLGEAVLGVSATKIYDGTTDVFGMNLTATGVYGDTVTLNGSIAYANKNAAPSVRIDATGIGAVVTHGAVLVYGYGLGSTASFEGGVITAKAVTVSGLSSASKVYDGTDAAVVNGSAALQTAITAGSGTSGDGKAYLGDEVSLTGTATGKFNDKDVADATYVRFGGLSLTGSESGNYTLTGHADDETVGITAKAVTVSGLSSASKVYDGTDAAESKEYDRTTVAAVVSAGTLAGVMEGDAVTFTHGTAAFDTKDAGTNKTVTLADLALTGTDASNYALPATVTDLADITPKSLALTGFAAQSKEYDRTTVASVVSVGTLAGVIEGDAVTFTHGAAAFDTKDAGTNKTVTLADLALTGTDASNYALPGLVTDLADITPKSLALTGFAAESKEYDRTTVASVVSAGTLAGVMEGDAVTFTHGAAAFDTKDAGTNKTVTLADLALTGTDAANYALPTLATATANITPKVLPIADLVIADKTYDGTSTASLAVTPVVQPLGEDQVVLGGAPVAVFVDKNAGTNKPVVIEGLVLEGEDAANYVLEQPSGIVADILPRVLTVEDIRVASKSYDQTTQAELAQSPTPTGVVEGDTVSLTYGQAVFEDPNAGSGKTVVISGLALSGDDATNYVLPSDTVTTTADIRPTSVVRVRGLDAIDKEYDGTTTAFVDTTAAVVEGVLAGDEVSIEQGVAQGLFPDRNAGADKIVFITGIRLTGEDAANYTLANEDLTDLATIEIREMATWLRAGEGAWSDPTRWDALPDANNVKSVYIPDGAWVTFDTTASGTQLDALHSAGTLSLTGGTLTVAQTISSTGYSQTGGTLTGAASMTVQGSFAQTGGVIDLTGAIDIEQRAGNLVVGQMRGASINLAAMQGGITQVGALTTAGLLFAQSWTGISLPNMGNRFGGFQARVTGPGDVVLAHDGPLDIQGIDLASGNIVVDNIGAVQTTALVQTQDGGVQLTANSPLTIGPDGVVATEDIVLTATDRTSAGNMTLNGPIRSTTGSATLVAADSYTQNSAIAVAGAVAVSTPGTITLGKGATTDAVRVAYADKTGTVAPPPTQAVASTPPKDIEQAEVEAVTFVDAFDKVLDVQVYESEAPLALIIQNVAEEAAERYAMEQSTPDVEDTSSATPASDVAPTSEQEEEEERKQEQVQEEMEEESAKPVETAKPKKDKSIIVVEGAACTR